MTGHDIVCVGFNDWRSEVRTNQHHLMERLTAAGNRVLFIESLGLRRPAVARRDIARILRRLCRGLGGPRQEDGVEVLSPLVVPLHGAHVAQTVNARLLPALVCRAVRHLHFGRPILWAYVPQAEVLLPSLRPSSVIYHCVDDIAAHPRVDSVSFDAAERRFARCADVILCSARPLSERMKRLAPERRVHLLPNVADTALFATAVDPGPVDAHLAALPEPRLVFIGAISGVKLDMDLVRSLGRRRRDWTIALVGPVGLGDPGVNTECLRLEPNIHLLGTRPYDALPSVLRGAAVGLIPYRRNALTDSIFPMKVYEYLAAGVPVVATPLPSLIDVAGVSLAEGVEGNIAAIERAIAEDSQQMRAARSRLASGHSWEARLAEIDAIWSASLERRSNPADQHPEGDLRPGPEGGRITSAMGGTCG